MPQMAPIWWSSLFSTFILSYIIVMMMIYYYNIYSPNLKSKTPINLKKMIWKW